MTFYQVLVLIVTSLAFGGFGFWIGKKSISTPIQTPTRNNQTLDIDAVKRYVESIDDFAQQVTPAWSRHIEMSRQQMEAAISQLTQRFSAITANLDDALNAGGASINNSDTDIFSTSNQRLQQVVNSLETA